MLAEFKDFQDTENEAIFFKDFPGCGNPEDAMGENNTRPALTGCGVKTCVFNTYLIESLFKDQ